MTAEQLIAPIVNFSIVAGVLVHYARKPVKDYFVTRSNSVKNEMQEAEAMAAEAGALRKEWETSWNSREALAQQFLDEAKATLKRAEEQGLEHAKQEAVRIKKEAQLLGQTEIVQAKRALGRELVEQSVSVARRYLKSDLDEKDRHKLVADYVNLVGNGHAG